MMNNEEILQALEEREKVLSEKVSELLKAQTELNQVRTAIAALSPTPILDDIFANNTNNKITWKAKIKDALNELGSASSQKIIDYIKTNYPDNDKVSVNVLPGLSVMVKNGEIRIKTPKTGIDAGKTLYTLL